MFSSPAAPIDASSTRLQRSVSSCGAEEASGGVKSARDQLGGHADARDQSPSSPLTPACGLAVTNPGRAVKAYGPSSVSTSMPEDTSPLPPPGSCRATPALIHMQVPPPLLGDYIL